MTAIREQRQWMGNETMAIINVWAIIVNRSALDLIGLNPLVPLWSLHNVVFFIASKLHLNEIFKSLENSAQQMFMSQRVSLFNF